jgi:hypothetical protein
LLSHDQTGDYKQVLKHRGHLSNIAYEPLLIYPPSYPVLYDVLNTL